jgi:hypothetical protein
VLAALALAPAALVAAPGALAHGGAASKLFLSQVTAVKPAVPGVTVVVLGRDDQLELENRSGKTVTVLGYEGEPYLRFDARGVAINLHSPARYLNTDRYAKVALPASADAKLPPQWDVLTLGKRWSWHDHRIHWMSTILPPAAKAAPGKPHLVFAWSVALTVAGSPAQIAGRLDYVPPQGGSNAGLILGIALPVGIILLAGAATGLLILRRRRLHPAAPA